MSENGFHTSLTFAKVYFYVFSGNLSSTPLKAPLFPYRSTEAGGEVRTFGPGPFPSLSASLSSDDSQEAPGVTVGQTAWGFPQRTAGLPKDQPSRGSEGAAAIPGDGGEMKEYLALLS